MTDTERILILDEPDATERLKALLEHRGWELRRAGGTSDALQQFQLLEFDIALVNIESKSIDPCKISKQLAAGCPDIRVVVLTNYSSVDKAVEALQNGAHAYVLKPFALDGLVKTLETALAQKRLIVSERRRAEAELTEAKNEIERLVQARVQHLLEANSQLKAELENRREDSQFRALYETAQDAIFMKDRNLTYTRVNPAAERLFGLAAAEWVGKTDDEVFGIEVAKPMRELDARVLQGEVEEKEQIVAVNGVTTALMITRIPLRDSSGNIIGLWGIARDLTETKRLERQFQAVQRIESLGTLAGGIAHNFNNLLTGILGTVSLLLMDMDPEEPKYRKLKRVEDYVRTGVDLTRQLLGFARGGKYEIQVVDLNEIVEKTTDVFSQTRKEIVVHREWEHDLWPVKADPGQIEQMLLNVYLNAWQAMPGGGHLYLKTENVRLDRTSRRPYTVNAGNYVQMTVRDTGIGMDHKTQERIFEPFYTTREVGKGTGLGLAAVYGIVKNHGGYIHVASEKGRGTSFEILLPAYEHENRTTGENAAAVLEQTKGKRAVLLVDDEEMILSVGKDLLEALGYEAITANNGEEALKLYREREDRIDLVILDIIMPGMSGAETYGGLRRINAGVKVLLSSGYSLDGETEKLLKNGCRGFIQKPYSMKDLSVKVREALL